MTTFSPQPWYRQLWPWLLMIAPVSAVLGGVATLWLSLASDDGLVADDYYKQGMAINRTLTRERVAQQLGLRSSVEFGERVRVTLSSERGGVQPPVLRLRVVHPTRAGDDESITLVRESHGIYTGGGRLPRQGQRMLILEDEARSWRLVGAIDSARVHRAELVANP